MTHPGHQWDEMVRSTSYYCPQCDRELESNEDLEATGCCPIDGSTLFSLPEGLSPGTVIDGRYTLLKPLGRGGMGVVFEAQHQATGQKVALKLISALGEDELSVRRFFREAKASTRIVHPGVVEVYDFGQTPDGRPYMAMEIIDGQPLDELLASEGALSPGRAIHITAEIASALAASHAQQILHRDLKPSNVMIRRVDGVERAKVLDFGLAKAVQDDTGELGTLTATGMLVGTPQYMSPEQFRCADLGPATDLYSLGCVLYEMLTGRPPFTGNNIFAMMQAHVMEAPTPLGEANPHAEIPPEIESICLRLMSKEIEQREPDTATLAQQLRALAGTTDVQSPSSLREDQQLPADSIEFSSATRAVSLPSLEAMESAEIERFRPALVGREQTRRFLEDILRRSVESNDPALISLEGPGGVGKSKLLEWYRGRAEQLGCQIVHGVHSDGHLGPLAALKGVIEDLLDISGQDWDAIEPRLDELDAHLDGADDDEAVALTRGERERLRQFLRPAVDESGQQEGFAPGDREILFETLLRVLRLACSGEPTLVIMDDLRDDRPFDPAFVDRLGIHLSEVDQPLVIIMAVRTSEAAADEAEQSAAAMMETAVSSLATTLREKFYRVELSPLGGEELHTLIRRAVPGISDGAADRIADLAGGNPLFTLQLLRNMVAEGSLRRDGGQWEIVGEPTLPDDLSGVIDARLARLKKRDSEEDLLVRAALIGQRVPLDLLEDVLEREGNFDLLDEYDDLLDRLIDDGWLRDAESWDEEAVLFEHGFVHEALCKRYGTKRAARKIHAVVAEALEVFYADELEPVASRIADHYLAGRRHDRALPYLIQSARAAEGRYAIDDAIDAWRRAEASLKRARAGQESASTIRRGLVRSLIYRADYDEAAQLLDQLPTDPKSLALRGALADALTELEDARKYYELAIAAAERENELTIRLSVGVDLAEIYQKLGSYDDASAQLREVLEHPEVMGPCRWRGVALTSWAMNSQHLGNFKDSLRSLEEAETVWKKVGDDVERGRCLYTLGSLYWRLSKFDQALDAYGRAIPLLERAGHRRGLGHCLRMAGVTAQELGRFDDALSYCQRAEQAFESIDDRRGLQRVALCYADILSSSGKYQESLLWAERALSLAASMKDTYGRCSSLVSLGEAQIGLTDFDSAIEILGRALELDMESGSADERRALIHERLADAMLQNQVLEQARNHFENAVEIYREIGNTNGATNTMKKLKQLQSATV